ncbi:MAG: helix-turn-helix domain-containing protein [Lachnospiraceae bacterium]|nr:helix-turn-helix domain-containing protein [Lachnospiraceae bacterium]MCD8363475.1 helix-turn-helix domain-containing protein [Lachnospiraceae bacterium]
MENRIRELREERGMNQDTLAGFVGVSQQKISRVERNTENLGIDLLIEISDYFHVTTDYLLCLSEERHGSAQEARLRYKMEEYQELIDNYESLNRDSRRLVLKLMRAMKKIEKEEKELL